MNRHRLPLITPRFQLRRALNGVLDVLYPDSRDTCKLCQRPFDGEAESLLRQLIHPNNAGTIGRAHLDMEGVCPFCLQDAHESFGRVYVRRLQVPQMRGREGNSPFVYVYASARYSGIVRNAIRKWKYDGVIELTNWFAEWTRRAHETLVRQGKASGYGPVDAIVPVPASRDRLQKRGYDHTGLLARRLENMTRVQARHWLLREQDTDGQFTQSQTAKTAAERLVSLRGVYRVDDATVVRGKRVLLMDDIVTTGATLLSCAAALFNAGAAGVQALVIADVE